MHLLFTHIAKRFFIQATLVISTYVQARAQKIDVSNGDPFFIVSNDTFSAYGPGHIVRDVLQARNGDLWLATWLGIIKYDGKIFTNYTLKNGLVKFHVACCYEDTKENIWFGTARGGVYCYNGRSFTLFTTKDGLIDNNIASILEDKAGNIWLGCERGVSMFDGRRFNNFNSANGFTSSFVNCMAQDKNGCLWLGTTEGLYVYNGHTFKKKTDIPFERITGLLADSKGNLWIGSFDGLVSYKIDSGKCTRLPFVHLAYYITEDKRGNIWFTHSEDNEHYTNIPDQVLYKYDGKIFMQVLHKDQPNDFQLFGKTVDRNGNLWFGTMHGVFCYDGKSAKAFIR